MRIGVILCLFALTLIISVTNSLISGRVFATVHDFRQAIFVSYEATNQANDILAHNLSPRGEPAEEVRSLLNTIEESGKMCVSRLGRFSWVPLGTGPIVGRCMMLQEEAVKTRALLDDMTDAMESGGSFSPTFFETRANLVLSVQNIRSVILNSRPVIKPIEKRLVKASRAITIATESVVFLVFCIASWSLIAVWKEKNAHADRLRQARDRIETQSNTDALTRLPNRRMLDLSLSQLDAEETRCLIRIDLDRFKQVNDILGHAAGDHVLCHVAKILRETTRLSDIPARVGGDEFVVLCGPETRLNDAREMAERLLDQILEPLEYDNKRCVYGASFGIAETIPGKIGPKQLLHSADVALYKAKSAGRGTVKVFTPELYDSARRERALADRFPDALQNGEIVPYFQTQHLADSWSIGGAEVLARWVHPEEGVLAPQAFLGIASQLGLESELDATMFEQAVIAVESLATEGLETPRTAFNTSAARIMSGDFLTILRHRIPRQRDRFAFEILESVSYETAGPQLDFAIDTIKEMGFQIDVDDFGSGHASINSVLRVEPHALKIDRDIIRPLGKSARSEITVKSILDFARSINVHVIAEGVDTEEKALILQRMGCDLLQGYFFSRPMPFSDYRDMLRAERLADARVDTG